jgi:hypothetical protein
VYVATRQRRFRQAERGREPKAVVSELSQT